MIIAKYKADKTRNFAVVGNTYKQRRRQTKFFPRVNKKVVIETLSIPIPIYINLDYKIVVKTEYQQQMNDLTQPFMTRTGQINSFAVQKWTLYEAFIDRGLIKVIMLQIQDERQFVRNKYQSSGYLIGRVPMMTALCYQRRKYRKLYTKRNCSCR